MAETIKSKIRDTALALLREAPDGLRYKVLHQAICHRMPDVSPHTIASEIHTLKHLLPAGSVMKGWYRCAGSGKRC